MVAKVSVMKRYSQVSLLVLGLVACAPTDQQVQQYAYAGGPGSGGIEGTGMLCDGLVGIDFSALDQCFYGEGEIVGTGITGTITGFGSIIVNGVHIEYDQAQEVESILGPASGKDLAIGQVVAVSTNMINGELVAERIVVQTALVGGLESLDLETGEAVVSGQSVALLSLLDEQLQDITVGQQVAVGGLYLQGQLQATSMRAVHGLHNSVSGYVQANADGSLRLHNGMPLPPSVGDLAEGDYVNLPLAGKQLVTKIYGKNMDGAVQRVLRESWHRQAKRKVATSSKIHSEAAGLTRQRLKRRQAQAKEKQQELKQQELRLKRRQKRKLL